MMHNLVKEIQNIFQTPQNFQREYNKAKIDFNNILLLENIHENNILLEQSNKQVIELNSKKITLEEQNSNFEEKAKKLMIVISDLDTKRESQESDRINQIIREVQNYLLNNKSNQICFVCGSSFNAPEELYSSIHKQLEKSEELRSELEQIYIEINSQLAKIRDDQGKTVIELEEITQKINEIIQTSELKRIEIEKLNFNRKY